MMIQYIQLRVVQFMRLYEYLLRVLCSDDDIHRIVISNSRSNVKAYRIVRILKRRYPDIYVYLLNNSPRGTEESLARSIARSINSVIDKYLISKKQEIICIGDICSAVQDSVSGR